jgi:hypothetical protein
MNAEQTVPYESLFQVNKTKVKKFNIEHQEENNTAYITSLNTKRNPDLLVPGGALKGNMYFKLTNGTNGAVEEECEVKSNESEADSTDDYKKLKSQVSRYYQESNPTLKCRNCKQFGHFARECPNERKLMNCILCGKDTHDSFECSEKLCFKCNKVGHKATECDAKNVDTCVNCNMVGHNQARCLKIWSYH